MKYAINRKFFYEKIISGNRIGYNKESLVQSISTEKNEFWDSNPLITNCKLLLVL
jgi:hypothetical protein